MKAWIAIGLLALSTTAAAQGASVVLDTRALLAMPWVPLPSSGSDNNAYQVSHALPRVSGGNAADKQYDVIFRQETKGADGKVSHVSFRAVALTCLPNGDVDPRVTLFGTRAYDSNAQGNPKNSADAHFEIQPASASVVDLDVDGPEGSVGKKLCSGRDH